MSGIKFNKNSGEDQNESGLNSKLSEKDETNVLDHDTNNEFDIDFDESELDPNITVLGVGGGGGNVINSMINDGIKGVKYVVANTDVRDLQKSKAKYKIQLGKSQTRGFGAGMDPELGRKSVEESLSDIKEVLKDTDMLFIAAGMGGGTGSGAAPEIAQTAMELKRGDRSILTVAVVTTPFKFEGRKRTIIANESLENLKKHVDTFMVIPNEKLFDYQREKEETLMISEAFDLVDNVLKDAISALTQIINRTGDINLDFADVTKVLKKRGKALFGTGYAEGKKRAKEAAHKAINSPLLSNYNIKDAKGIIIHVVADSDLKLDDLYEASTVIEQAANANADVILGLTKDSSFTDETQITIIAAGFDNDEDSEENTKTLSATQKLHEEFSGEDKEMKISEISEISAKKNVRSFEEPVQTSSSSGSLRPNYPNSQTNQEDVYHIPENEIKSVQDDLHYPDNNEYDSDSLDLPAYIRRREKRDIQRD